MAGHRRHRASLLAGLAEMPVIVRELDDDEATIIMVDSNLQRETLLPSERAFAYRMKLEAMKHQGERRDLTSCQVGTKLNSCLLYTSIGGNKVNAFLVMENPLFGGGRLVHENAGKQVRQGHVQLIRL